MISSQSKPGSVRSSLRGGLIGLFFFLLAITTVTQLEAQPSREYQVKAVFLFNFAQFVEWPKEAFASDNSPFVIGVLGQDPFGDILDTTVKDETINNRRVKVVRVQNVDELPGCNLLFISKSERQRYKEIIEAIDSKSILTVSEVDGFAESGGIINFYLAGNKLRFEVNPSAASRCGLKLSSQLLNLGKIVGPSNKDT